MDALVLFTLILNVAPDHFLVAVLTDRIHVKTTGPKVSSPESSFDIGMGIEDVFGCEMLDRPCDT